MRDFDVCDPPSCAMRPAVLQSLQKEEAKDRFRGQRAEGRGRQAVVRVFP